ncbi:MAG: hypothetical protein U0670_06615 [Anaerolineae bacterium]
MFKGKSNDAPAATSCAVMLLHEDYIVRGGYDLQKAPAWGILVVSPSLDSFHSPELLTAVQIQTVRESSLPDANKPNWNIRYNDLVLAAPWDDAGVAFFLKQNRDMKYPFNVEAYVGQYVVRGTMYGHVKDFSLLTLGRSVAIQNATVDGIAPVSRVKSLRIPYGVLHLTRMQGIVVLS